MSVTSFSLDGWALALKQARDRGLNQLCTQLLADGPLDRCLDYSSLRDCIESDPELALAWYWLETHHRTTDDAGEVIPFHWMLVTKLLAQYKPDFDVPVKATTATAPTTTEGAQP